MARQKLLMSSVFSTVPSKILFGALSALSSCSKMTEYADKASNANIPTSIFLIAFFFIFFLLVGAAVLVYFVYNYMPERPVRPKTGPSRQEATTAYIANKDKAIMQEVNHGGDVDKAKHIELEITQRHNGSVSEKEAKPQGSASNLSESIVKEEPSVLFARSFNKDAASGVIFFSSMKLNDPHAIYVLKTDSKLGRCAISTNDHLPLLTNPQTFLTPIYEETNLFKEGMKNVNVLTPAEFCFVGDRWELHKKGKVSYH